MRVRAGRSPARAGLVNVAALASFGAAGWGLERAAWFEPLRRAMRDPTVPAHALDVGTLGKVLRHEDLVTTTRPRRDGRWRGTDSVRVYTPYRGGGGGAPSASDVLAAPHLVAGLPTLSLAVDEADLHDPVRGLFPNWRFGIERPAHVSYFEGLDLRFALGCGVRLHGHSTRRPDRRRRDGASFRVYLREEYGPEQFPEGVLFEREHGPLDRLVVRGVASVASSIAFDVARRLGSTTPAMRPVNFVFNGEPQGVYVVAEHLTRRLWRRVLGHDDFAFFRARGDNSPSDAAAASELRRWIDSLGVGEVTAELVGTRVDVDRLSRHLFAIAWCGTDDWAQGAAVLDRVQAEPRWTWVHWDMDRSFHPSVLLEGGPWTKPALDLLLGEVPLDVPEGHVLLVEREFQTTTGRGALFRGLVRDDPTYRASFVALATHALNHELTAEFLEACLARYEPFVGPRNLSEQRFEQIGEFLRFRSAFVLLDLGRAFALGPPLRCVVEAPPGVRVAIDGVEATERYEGWYFAGQTLALGGTGDAADPHDPSAEGPRLRGWLVDGRLVAEPELELAVERALHVEAVFE
jgi:hypothetical protein